MSNKNQLMIRDLNFQKLDQKPFESNDVSKRLNILMSFDIQISFSKCLFDNQNASSSDVRTPMVEI